VSTATAASRDPGLQQPGQVERGEHESGQVVGRRAERVGDDLVRGDRLAAAAPEQHRRGRRHDEGQEADREVPAHRLDQLRGEPDLGREEHDTTVTGDEQRHADDTAIRAAGSQAPRPQPRAAGQRRRRARRVRGQPRSAR
jgi:hypothetical protein